MDGGRQRGVGGALGDGRGESYTVFSPTLGVYISPAPSASDALKDQWWHTVRSNTTVRAKLVNKQHFQKNAFVYSDVNRIGGNRLLKYKYLRTRSAGKSFHYMYPKSTKSNRFALSVMITKISF